MDAGEKHLRPLVVRVKVVVANIKLVLDSLVGKNPYRVLGVYGNATSREVQKNLSRMAAFAKVGRTEEFYTDFNVAFRVSFQRLNAESEDAHFKLERDEEWWLRRRHSCTVQATVCCICVFGGRVRRRPTRRRFANWKPEI